MTATELKKINERLPKVNIKGKEYVMVKDRVTAFREICPEGSIETEVLSHTDGAIIMKATVRDGDVILSTGTAWEKESNGYINKTSYVENCETSAIGRALGFAGIGIDDSMASAEEVANAILNQNSPEKITAKDVEAIKNACKKRNIQEKTLLHKYQVKSLNDITVEDFTKYGEKSLKAWVESENTGETD